MDTSARAVVSAFIQGLARPSRLSVAVAVAVILAATAACLGFVTSDRLAGEAIRYVARGPLDDDAFVTSRVLALAQSADKRPLIAIIGASATRESFGSPADIAAEFKRQSGIDVDVESFCTGRQNPLEHAVILDALKADRPVLVVLGIGPSRFTWSAAQLADSYENPRLGIRSQALNDEAVQLGAKPFNPTGNYVLDHASFVVPRLPSLIVNMTFRRPQTEKLHRFTGKMSDDDFNRQGHMIVQRLKDYADNFSINREIIERMGSVRPSFIPISFVIVEAPINPEFLKRFRLENFYENHLNNMRDIAADLNVPYWTLAKDINLSSQEFYDWAHVNNLEIKEKIRSELVNRLSRYSLLMKEKYDAAGH